MRKLSNASTNRAQSPIIKAHDLTGGINRVHSLGKKSLGLAKNCGARVDVRITRLRALRSTFLVKLINKALADQFVYNRIVGTDIWMASKTPVKVGGSAPATTNDDSAKLIRAALGLPIQLVTGCKGTAPIKLAAESGAIDGGCWAWESIKVMWRQGLDAVSRMPARISFRASSVFASSMATGPLASQGLLWQRLPYDVDIAGSDYPSLCFAAGHPQGSCSDIAPRLYTNREGQRFPSRNGQV